MEFGDGIRSVDECKMKMKTQVLVAKLLKLKTASRIEAFQGWGTSSNRALTKSVLRAK